MSNVFGRLKQAAACDCDFEKTNPTACEGALSDFAFPILMAPDIPNIGSWLDALKQHSIFSLSEKEHEDWRYWENSGDDFSNKLPATMVIRDGDLFVAVGSTIRALNLNQFKNLWVKSIQEGGRFADWIHQFPYKV
jgi:hypothetical protein